MTFQPEIHVFPCTKYHMTESENIFNYIASYHVLKNLTENGCKTGLWLVVNLGTVAFLVNWNQVTSAIFQSNHFCYLVWCKEIIEDRSAVFTYLETRPLVWPGRSAVFFLQMSLTGGIFYFEKVLRILFAAA